MTNPTHELGTQTAQAMLSSIFLLTLAPSLWLTPAVRPTAPTPVARRRAIAPVCQDRWAPESTELSTADKERILLDWLESNGVYISGMSTWGRPAHPLRVESDTMEDFEPSGRGLLARKQILQGEPVMQIGMKLVMTKLRSQAVLGTDVVPDSMGEYIAIALLLMHEKLKGANSFWAPYIDLLCAARTLGRTRPASTVRRHVLACRPRVVAQSDDRGGRVLLHVERRGARLPRGVDGCGVGTIAADQGAAPATTPLPPPPPPTPPPTPPPPHPPSLPTSAPTPPLPPSPPPLATTSGSRRVRHAGA